MADDGVNQRQLTDIRDTLEKNGITSDLIACRKREIKGWENRNWGIRFRVDALIKGSNPEDYDGIIIPGGVLHADRLRENEGCNSFIRQLFTSGKIVAALGHGVQVLIGSGILEERKVTGSPSIATDLRNAGAIFQDQDIVIDNGLLTAKNEKSVTAFMIQLVDALRRGLRQRSDAVI